MKTPIVMLVYNRPDKTAAAFQAVRTIRPAKLLIVADGPRAQRPDDHTRCQATRAIFEEIDWPCEVLTNYAEQNLGCRRRVSSGLNWVFEQVETAIILEDDCVPHPSFFQFSEELLEKYQDDERIMVISGNNFQQGRQRSADSYYFSIYPHCWGWATWRRAWQHYDDTMTHWPQVRNSLWLKQLLGNQRNVDEWSHQFQATFEEKRDSWAYRWTLSCWLQSGLTILPNVNLVTNIGFDENATNTKRQKSTSGNIPATGIRLPIQHPAVVVRDWEADQYTEAHHFGNAFIRHYGRRIFRFGRSQVQQLLAGAAR